MMTPVCGSRGGTGQRTQGLLPSKFTSPMRKRTALRSSSPKSWSSQNGGTSAVAAAERSPSISSVGKKRANSLQASGGDNRWAVGDGVIRKSFGSMADGDRLPEEVGKPFGGGRRVPWERKCLSWDFATVAGNRKNDRAEVRGEYRADQVDSCVALAVNPLSVDGVKRPRAVEFQAAGRADARFFHGNRIERLDRMQSDVCKARRNWGWGHAEILAEGRLKES